MSGVEWHLVELARTRAMANRLQQEALDRAEAAGITEPRNQTSFAFGWLAGEAARRIVRLENARDVPDPSAQGAAAPVPDTPQRGGVTPIRPRASRK